MNLKDKAILVTGGAGFIGSHLVDELVNENPNEIVVIDNFFLGKERNLQTAKSNSDKLFIYDRDATDLESVNEILIKHNIDIVFNLAVIPLPTSLVKPIWTFGSNVKMTEVLCELQRKGYFETLIHFSSSEAYGDLINFPMSEEHPLNITTPYAASKASADLLVLSYSKTFETDVTILRPFNNFGPRQNEKAYAGIIPTVIQTILQGESPIIFGDGEQTRDYIYVKETAKASIRALKHPETKGNVINIASGQEITINHIVSKICDIMNSSKRPIYREPRVGDLRRHCADIQKAKKLMNFNYEISFDEALETTIDWYVKRLSR